MDCIDRNFSIEEIYDILMEIINTNFDPTISECYLNAKLNENIDVDSIITLLSCAFNSEYSHKDLETFFMGLYECIDFSGQNIVELFQKLTLLLRDTDDLLPILNLLRIDVVFSFTYQQIKEIVDFCIRESISGSLFVFLIATSIGELEIQDYEGLLEDVSVTSRLDLLENVLLYWPDKYPADKKRIYQIFNSPIAIEPNFPVVAFALISRRLIDVPFYFELIEYFKSVSVDRTLAFIAGFSYGVGTVFTTSDFKKLLNILRELNSIEYILFLLPYLSESQILELLSEQERKMDFKKFFNLEHNRGTQITFNKLLDSAFFYMDFQYCLLSLAERMDPTTYGGLLRDIFKCKHYSEEKIGIDKWESILTEATQRKNGLTFIKAYFENISLATLRQFEIRFIERFLAGRLEPKNIDNKSVLDGILENYTSPSFQELFDKNQREFEQKIEQVDVDELIERMTELTVAPTTI